ncbi:MAG: hypothetical protein JWM04_9 [Verrucomicrobiales bacterium]|jgi:hypothetical protein|nr:hypothetical protein [Verrucomicrobiales bacterium]
MKIQSIIVMSLVLSLAGGCSKTDTASSTNTPKAATAHHEHKPPHGGAPVELGEEEYHVEFVTERGSGILRAFVMDGELENFVRIEAPTLEVTAKLPGKEEILILKPVPNSATGETVGNTSLFEGQADWLKTTTNFDAVLKQISVKTKTYTNVIFNFPKGSDEGAKK